jgi:hypothetical protein
MERASALFRGLLQQPDHFLVQLRWNLEALSSGSWLKKELGSSMSIRVSSSPSR